MLSAVKRNIYLYIIWQRGRHVEARIREDLKRNYRIIKEYEVKWPWYHAVNNYAFFYRHIAFFSWLRKCWICGTGAFRMIMVEDVSSPDRETANRLVEKLKLIYRAWAGKRWRVHGSANPAETRYQYWLLTGRTLEELLNEPASGEAEMIMLNKPITFNYAILDR